MPSYGHSPGPSDADPMKMKLPKGPAPGASKTPSVTLVGVIDPAKYSDRAVVVVEIDARKVDDMSDYDFSDFKEAVEYELGMPVLLLVGARLARIEEPADD